MKIFILVTSLFVMVAGTAMACSCLAPNKDSAQQTYQQADIIIRANIGSVSLGWNGLSPRVRLNVLDVMRGNRVPDLITAEYNTNTAACGQNFRAGEDVILALYDIRDPSLLADNDYGYGFRVMTSCDQAQIQYFLETIIDKEK